MNQPLPSYIYDENNKRCWLTLRADIHGRWQAFYEVPQGPIAYIETIGPIVEDALSPNDAMRKLADLRVHGL